MQLNWKLEPIAVAFCDPGCATRAPRHPPEVCKQSNPWPCLRLGPFLVGISPICFKSPLMYFSHSILLGFICLGSGLKGHVVSLGLLSINACLFSAEVQAVLFIYLFGGFKVIKHEALPSQ